MQFSCRATFCNFPAPVRLKDVPAIERSGVPTCVIYPAGSGAMPGVLPELLSRQLCCA